MAKETQEWFEEEACEAGATLSAGCSLSGQKAGGEEEDPPQNLAHLSNSVRHRRAMTLFRRLLPSVQSAALRGASRLVVTTRARELAEMGKEIATMLFPYGIHSVIAHARSFASTFSGRRAATAGAAASLSTRSTRISRPVLQEDEDEARRSE